MGYEAFESMIEALKEAGLDARMHEDQWKKAKSKDDYYQTTYYEDGSYSDRWASECIPDVFNEVRKEIDDIVTPWRLLPDPDDIAELVSVCRTVTRRLAVNPDSNNDLVTGAGPMVGPLMLIKQNLFAMSGATIAAFKMNVLAPLDSTIGGLHAVSIVRGLNAARQEELWRATRKELVSTISKATAAMNAIASGGPVDWGRALTVTGWIAKGLSIFEVPGADKVGDAVDLIVEIKEDGKGDNGSTEDSPYHPRSYSQAIKDLKDSLSEINKGIRHSETLINDNLVENLKYIRSDKASYDITQTPIYSVTAEDGMQSVNPGLVGEIFSGYMPAIVSELNAAAQDVDNSSRHLLVLRDDEIGIGAEGPSPNFSDLNWLLYDLLKNMAVEVGYAANNLESAVNDLIANNEESAEALRLAADTVAEGSDFNPWG